MFRLLKKDLPHHVVLGIDIAILIWAWIGFKWLEPVVWPVVTDFEVTLVDRQKDRVRIAGTMDKQRDDCAFDDLVIYSKGALVGYTFDETPNETHTRVEGDQSWGWWTLLPPVREIEIYVRHECATGAVTTQLFRGEI